MARFQKEHHCVDLQRRLLRTILLHRSRQWCTGRLWTQRKSELEHPGSPGGDAVNANDALDATWLWIGPDDHAGIVHLQIAMVFGSGSTQGCAYIRRLCELAVRTSLSDFDFESSLPDRHAPDFWRIWLDSSPVHPS